MRNDAGVPYLETLTPEFRERTRRRIAAVLAIGMFLRSLGR